MKGLASSLTDLAKGLRSESEIIAKDIKTLETVQFEGGKFQSKKIVEPMTRVRKSGIDLKDISDDPEKWRILDAFQDRLREINKLFGGK